MSRDRWEHYKPEPAPDPESVRVLKVCEACGRQFVGKKGTKECPMHAVISAGSERIQ